MDEMFEIILGSKKEESSYSDEDYLFFNDDDFE